ncbi:MAG: hypothetical protein V1900_04465 [Candidatus Aenigmatarchaeota archaeon]
MKHEDKLSLEEATFRGMPVSFDEALSDVPDFAKFLREKYADRITVGKYHRSGAFCCGDVETTFPLLLGAEQIGIYTRISTIDGLQAEYKGRIPGVYDEEIALKADDDFGRMDKYTDIPFNTSHYIRKMEILKDIKQIN